RFSRFRIATGITLILAAAPISDLRAEDEPGPPRNTVRFRIKNDPATLDWNLAHTSYETYVIMNLMEGLVHLDSDLKPAPALAESWEVSKDGKQYTFKIRKGVKWSDGVELTAGHFVDSWRRLLSPR